MPVWISAADPRWWAAHKLWLAEEPTREPLKRHRDQDQGYAVAAMLARAWEAVEILSDEMMASIPATCVRIYAMRFLVEQSKPRNWSGNVFGPVARPVDFSRLVLSVHVRCPDEWTYKDPLSLTVL